MNEIFQDIRNGINVCYILFLQLKNDNDITDIIIDE